MPGVEISHLKSTSKFVMFLFYNFFYFSSGSQSDTRCYKVIVETGILVVRNKNDISLNK